MRQAAGPRRGRGRLARNSEGEILVLCLGHRRSFPQVEVVEQGFDK